MKYLMLFASVCVVAAALGLLSEPRAQTSTDSLWAKAVALSKLNQNLVPGLMKMRMREVDKHGNPKDDSTVVWSTLSLDDDGEVKHEVVKVLENGKDVTEEAKAKEEEDAKKEEDEDGDEENSGPQKMEGYSPFDWENQQRVSIKALGGGEIVNGRGTVLYEFTENTEDDVEISGKAWLEAETGVPVRIEYTSDPLPKRVKHMVTTLDYEYTPPDSLTVRRMFVEVTGGILFIKKHFHMGMTFDKYWRLPEQEEQGESVSPDYSGTSSQSGGVVGDSEQDQ